MKAELWGRAKEIYNSALERRPGQCGAFVAEACGGDEALRAEVESMLGWQSQADNFIESPAMEVAGQAMAANITAEASADLSGGRLLHYRIDEKIGAGGMGVVYRARDTHLDRFVAIKTLPPDRVADPDRKRRFIQEAKAASALNHPNIVTVHDIGQAEGIDYIAMEYVAGKTLDELIPRKGMRPSVALKYAVQIADALARAHGAGIVHRDIKPSNIVVDEHGLAKVLDFGLAKLTEAAEPETKTVSTGTGEGTIIGTPAYMSPEQAEGRHVDTRSDIFSFGSMLYEMLTGQRAFRGDTRASTIASILHQEPEPLTGAVPPELERIIRKCMRKEPEKRFQHIDDVKSELDDLVEESASVKNAGAVRMAGNRRKLIWMLAGAGVLMVLAWASWRFGRLFFGPQVPSAVKFVTTYPGQETGPTLSPDGRQVAFSWNGEKQDNPDIYVQQVKGGAPLRLTTNPANDYEPAWSPDGSEIAFLRRNSSSSYSLNLISPQGGPERKIAESPRWFGDVSWTPDGEWLAVNESTGSTSAGLFLISPETREKRLLVNSPAGDLAQDSSCAFSPDGRQIAFVRYIKWQVTEIWVAPFAGGAPRQLTRDNKVVSSPVWTPDGKEIIFSSNRLGSWNLWRIRANAPAGTEPSLIPNTEGAMEAAISADPPARLVFARRVFDINIWTTEMLSDGLSYGAPRPLIESTRLDAYAQFSPDGQKIAYVSGRAGEEGCWLADSDGSNPIQLTTKQVFGAHDWSPDGSKIGFGYLERLLILDASGGEPRAVTTGASDYSGVFARPHWSRDGMWFYFNSSHSGNREIWKMPAAGGTPIQLTRDGGMEGWESPDGKMFYYTRRWDAPGLWVMPVDGGEQHPVLDTVWHGCWAMADGGIYFVDLVTSKPPVLRFYEFGTQKVKAIMPVDKVVLDGSQNLTVTRDGRRVAWHQVDRNEVDLVQIENFR